MTNVPNTFISETGELIFINSEELSPEEIGHIAECKAYCNIVEKHFGTSDIDEMMRKDIGYKAMKKYICARHDLISYGYNPEDWKA